MNKDLRQDERLAVLETLIHERFNINQKEHNELQEKLDRLFLQVSSLNLWKAKMIGFAVALATIVNLVYDFAKAYILKSL